MTQPRTLPGASIGAFLASGSDVIAGIMAGAGLDWLLVDLEHGSGGEDALVRQMSVILAAGIPCYVRVESSDRIRIGRALDLGVDGVMVPRVDSPEIADAVARAARFAPWGDRGVATSTRAARYGQVPVADLATLEPPLVIVQIESQAAVSQVESIASISGVDCLFVGPADLSSSLGVPGDLESPVFEECLRQILAAAATHHKSTGIMAGSPDGVQRYLKMGFNMVALSSDVVIMTKAARDLVQLAGRRGLAPSRPATRDGG